VRFASFDSMVSSDEIDIIAIATPDHWHAQQAISSIGSGVHVWIEPSLANSLAELDDLARVVRNAKGSVFWVKTARSTR
jgi:predicted dehydrogenase